MSTSNPEPLSDQAALVYARILNLRKYGSHSYDGIDFGVINDSDAPIYDIVAKVQEYGQELRAPSIGPGKTRSTGMGDIDAMHVVNNSLVSKPEEVAVEVSFTDKFGVRWTRVGYGRPTAMEG